MEDRKKKMHACLIWGRFVHGNVAFIDLIIIIIIINLIKFSHNFFFINYTVKFCTYLIF